MWEGLLFEEPPLARHPIGIKTMDYFGYLGKKGPGRWRAPGTAGVPGKAWRPGGQGRRREGKQSENEVLHKTSVKGVLAPEVDGSLSPQFSFIFFGGSNSGNKLQGKPAIKLQSPDSRKKKKHICCFISWAHRPMHFSCPSGPLSPFHFSHISKLHLSSASCKNPPLNPV